MGFSMPKQYNSIYSDQVILNAPNGNQKVKAPRRVKQTPITIPSLTVKSITMNKTYKYKLKGGLTVAHICCVLTGSEWCVGVRVDFRSAEDDGRVHGNGGGHHSLRLDHWDAGMLLGPRPHAICGRTALPHGW